MSDEPPDERWEHFPHGADIGVRGYGPSLEAAFEQAATAMTAVLTDPDGVAADECITVTAEAPDLELLFFEWLNAIVFEMATRDMLFSRFDVTINGNSLVADICGEPIDRERHEPAVEIKGATLTMLKVARNVEGGWMVQTVVDV